jgi:hypothetical protein
MTVNELIEQLQKLKEEHGDIECIYIGSGYIIGEEFDCRIDEPTYSEKYNAIVVVEN